MSQIITVIFDTPGTPPALGYIVRYREVGTSVWNQVTPNPTSSPVNITVPSGKSWEGTVQAMCSNSSISSPQYWSVLTYELYVADKYQCGSCSEPEEEDVIVAAPIGSALAFGKFYRFSEFSSEENPWIYYIKPAIPPNDDGEPHPIINTTPYNTCAEACETPMASNIYYNIAQGVVGGRLIIRPVVGENLVNQQSSTSQPFSGNVSGLSGNFEIVAQWVSGSGNVIKMRVCDANNEEVAYESITVGGEAIVSVSLPSANAPYFVHLTTGGVEPANCG